MNAFADPFRETPLGIVAIALFVGLILAREAGHFIKLRQAGRAPDQSTDDSFTLTAALGLLALLISFTFSLSLNRYDARREFVVEEANALGTTWLRTQLLDEPGRTQFSGALRDYIKTRLAFGDARTMVEEKAAYRDTVREQSLLWPILRDAIAPIRTTALGTSLIATTNDSFDLAATRTATRAAHVPARVLAALVLFAGITAGLIGYEKGRFRVSTMLLFVLLTLAIALILDLDRPRSGAIEVLQQPMLDLWAGIK